MTEARRLSAEAERVSAALPPLLAEAERVAASILGAHGRRASGPGESFWQYRRAMPGDSNTSIDWRRSGQSDDLFVRETEWEAAQTCWIWADDAASMRFRSKTAPVEKERRAALLALALCVLLERGGERFALMRMDENRRTRGRIGLNRIAYALTTPRGVPRDFGRPPEAPFTRGGRGVFMSDFFGDLDLVKARLSDAVAKSMGGIMLQIVDPAEEAFPYRGRVAFESLGGSLRYDADRAEAMRDAYTAKLAERRDALRTMASAVGWRFAIHRTDTPVEPALLMLFSTLQGVKHGRASA